MINEILKTRTENAITADRICDILGISKKDLAKAINKERQAGHPICANTSKHPGYYLAANKTEMFIFCNSLKHRAGEIFKTRKACLDMIDNLPGEMPPIRKNDNDKESKQ